MYLSIILVNVFLWGYKMSLAADSYELSCTKDLMALTTGI